MKSDRRQRQQHVTGPYLFTVDYLFSVGNSNNEASHIILAGGIKIGHLRRLAAQQNAAISATATGYAFDDTGNNFGQKFSSGDIVKKEERPRPLHKDVVHTMIDKIASDCVVNAGEEGNLQFRPDAIRGSHQHRMLQIRESSVKHSSEASYFGKSSLVECLPGEFFDFVSRACSRVDINACVAVGDGFSH